MAWLKTREAIAKTPSLILRGQFSYSLDHMPLRARGISAAKRWNMLRAGFDALRRHTRLSAMPPALQIEPTNLCNLKCPLCPTGAGVAGRKRGMMSFDLFRRILDENRNSLVSVILYGWGEPFLNPDLPRMIAECSARGIVTATSTNGHCIRTIDDALAVVDAGLKALVIALDGSTQEIYESYRKGGDVNAVQNCAALIEEAKRLRNSAFPYTNMRMVLMRENQHDLPNIRRIARDLGVNMFSYKSVGCLTTSPEYGKFETHESALKRFDGKSPSKEVRCPYAFRQPTIYWDGTVVGCEFDCKPMHPWGRIGELSFQEIWNGPKALRMRNGILGHDSRLDFCSACPYRDEGQEKAVLASETLRPAFSD